MALHEKCNKATSMSVQEATKLVARLCKATKLLARLCKIKQSY